MLTDYTTTAEIRAVLGVDLKDLADSTITLPIYETQLLVSMDDITPDIYTQYQAIAAVVNAAGTLTAVQSRFYNVVRAFATYSACRILLSGLPYFAIQQVTDGRAGANRITDPYAPTRISVDAAYAVLVPRVVTAYKNLGFLLTTVATRIYGGGTSISSDPVTQ